VAFSLNSNGGRKGGRFQGGPALSEINVTPFVDVLLVLLIIFMLTAHVMETGIEVDVPTVKTTKETTKELPIVSINKASELFLGDKIVNLHDLASSIVKQYGKAQPVYVRADKSVSWEIVANVIGELGAAKINPSMVTKVEEISRRKR